MSKNPTFWKLAEFKGSTVLHKENLRMVEINVQNFTLKGTQFQ